MRQIRNLFTRDDAEMVDFVNSLPKEDFYFVCDGRVYHDLDSIEMGKLIAIQFRMLGGKGGFGSLLRSFRIHKSHNQLMCRNLHGRRLADVKEEQRLKKWVEKKAQREKEKEEKEKEKIEKLKSGSKIKHEFKDQSYLRRRDTVLDEVEDAIEAGMKALDEKKTSSETEESGEDQPTTFSSSNDASNGGKKLNDQPGPSTSSGNGQIGTKEANGNVPEPAASDTSDSDFELDELMSAGPIKKKAKKG